MGFQWFVSIFSKVLEIFKFLKIFHHISHTITYANCANQKKPDNITYFLIFQSINVYKTKKIVFSGFDNILHI